MKQQSFANSYLETLQEAVYKDLGIPLEDDEHQNRSETFRFLKERAERERVEKSKKGFFGRLWPKKRSDSELDLEEAFRRIAAEQDKLELPSRYQRRSSYLIVKDIADEMEEAAKKVSAKGFPSRPTFGTLPLPQVNAMAISVPEDQSYIILFQDGLFAYLHLLSKVIALALPIREGEDGLEASVDIEKVKAYITNDGEAIRRFEDMMTAYLFGGNPYYAEQYLLDAHHMPFSEILLASAKFFILGHEYGHIMGGHFNQHQRVSHALSASIKAHVIEESWGREFEADFTGMQLQIATMNQRKFDVSLSYLGAEFFFAAVQLLESAIAFTKFGKVARFVSDSHPPSSMRVRALREGLRLFVGDERASNAINLAETMWLITNELWSNVEARFAEFHSSQRQLAPMWQGITSESVIFSEPEDASDDINVYLELLQESESPDEKVRTDAAQQLFHVAPIVAVAVLVNLISSDERLRKISHEAIDLHLPEICDQLPLLRCILSRELSYRKVGEIEDIHDLVQPLSESLRERARTLLNRDP